VQERGAQGERLLLGELAVGVDVRHALDAVVGQREEDALDRSLAETVEEAALQVDGSARVDALDARAPRAALGDEQQVVEDQLVGAHRERLARHGGVHELVELREAVDALEARDHVPALLGHEAVGTHLPVEVAEALRAGEAREVVGHEVVVRDRVGGEVREVAADEGALEVTRRERAHLGHDAPAVAVAVGPAGGLQVDDVGGDVAVGPSLALLAHQATHGGAQTLALAEDAVLELEVISGPPSEGEREQGDEEQQGEGHQRKLS